MPKVSNSLMARAFENMYLKLASHTSPIYSVWKSIGDTQVSLVAFPRKMAWVPISCFIFLIHVSFRIHASDVAFAYCLVS